MTGSKSCAAVLLAVCAAACTAAEAEVLNLSAVKPVVLTAHVNGKNASVPKGARQTVTPEGIVLDYVFPSKGHDACMVEFPVDQKKFSQITVELTADKPGHRPFIVLTDKNGEKHYFSLNGSRRIKDQAIKKAGRQKLTTKIQIKNGHPGEYFAFRWGGDDNQVIDFPVKKIMLGLNDYPDESTGTGRIVFHSITFK